MGMEKEKELLLLWLVFDSKYLLSDLMNNQRCYYALNSDGMKGERSANSGWLLASYQMAIESNSLLSMI